MRSVEQQLEAVLASVDPLESFPIALLEARGCVLAEDVTAPWSLPAFDSASVDGYAVRVFDVAGASSEISLSLRVQDTIGAGEKPGKSLIPGCAIRVSAGAPLPEETEAVVPVEYTDGGTEYVAISRSVAFGQYVRRSGEDVLAGSVVAAAGTEVDARILGLLAAVGRGQIEARPRPRVVVVSIGSELLPPGTPLEPGKVADSNGIMLAAAVGECGGKAFRVGPIPDDEAVIEQVLTDQLVRADAVIITGGTSASSYEAVRSVLNKIGNVEYSKIAMYPGAAQGFGRIGEEHVPIIMLPGSPAAAFVSFEVFVRPVMRKLLGLSNVGTPLQRAYVSNGFRSISGRRHYVRAIREHDAAGRHIVTALEGQGTHLIASLAKTQCLIVVPESVTDVSPGDVVDVLLLNDAAVW